MSLPQVPHAGEVSGERARGRHPSQWGTGAAPAEAMGMGADPNEPIPELVVAWAMGGMSGALTGGLAAGSWQGAAVGAGVNTALWSFFTLAGSWRSLGAKSRITLGVGGTLAAAVATAYILKRRKR
jgi:hypothetical protein